MAGGFAGRREKVGGGGDDGGGGGVMSEARVSRHREARKLPVVLVGAPHKEGLAKGQAPGRVNPWITPSLPHT